MKRPSFYFILVLFSFLLLTACTRDGKQVRGIYHWKTTYNPTQYELDWMQEHHVDRLYLRLFDVDVYGCDEGAAPIATTRFIHPLPSDIEIVPVVYITNEALSSMNTGGVADALAQRVLKMAECNGFEVKELQVDCDWSERTKYQYRWFCHDLRELLHEHGIRLSSTVRLHQIDSMLASLEVDSKALMLYNTGDLRSPLTRNSILDYDDVKPYLRRLTAEAMDSMAVAWPVFGWGVAFDETGRFSHLVGSASLGNDTTGRLREEWGEMEQMLRVQKQLPRRKGEHVTILYHLDSLNLSRYSYDEIEELYSR